MRVRQEVSQQDYELIRDMTQAGQSYYEVASKVPHLKRHDIRAIYSGFRTAVHRIADLTLQELEEAKARVQEDWTPEEFGKRWVGRFALKEETSLQQAASKLMPH